jgi:hypothetical protein
MSNPPPQGYGAAGVQFSWTPKSFERKNMTVKLRSVAFSAVLTAVVFAGCAQPSKPVTVERAAAVQVGSRFDGVGTVTLHTGQPCASQIMFDFKRTRSARTIWLAANAKDEKLLADATTCDCPIHVVGIWRRGSSPNCYYVSVTSVVRDQYR